MEITAKDISAKEFKRSLRGYDEAQVDIFLDELMAQWEKTAQRINGLEQELHKMRERVAYYEGLEESIKLALVSAQKTATDLVATAQKRAETLLESALEDAQRVTESAEENARLSLEAAEQNAAQLLETAQDNARMQQEETDRMRQAHQQEEQKLRERIDDYRLRATEMLRQQIELLSSMDEPEQGAS